MTKLPQPGDWTTHYCTTYDAWNRLVEVRASDDTTVIAQYRYDGRNYRTVKKTYASGELAETRHFYYNNAWQLLEERLETSGVIASTASVQNVWGLRYVDDLILRDRDADSSSATGSLGVTGSGLEERLYTMQDPNWNVVAIADTTGAVQERFSYSAYGTPTFLTSAFAARSPNSSSYAWTSLYTGREYDAETYLYQYRNRYYDAELGRFVNRDPIGFAGADTNFYRYVKNEPQTATDPRGLVVPGGTPPVPNNVEWTLTTAQLQALIDAHTKKLKGKYCSDFGCNAHEFEEAGSTEDIEDVVTFETKDYNGDITVTANPQLGAWFVSVNMEVSQSYAVTGTLARRDVFIIRNEKFRCCWYEQTNLYQIVCPQLFSKKHCGEWKNRYTFFHKGVASGWIKLSVLAGATSGHWTGGTVGGWGGYGFILPAPADNSTWSIH